MDEWDSKAEEDAVRRLIEEAGPRPAIPPEDLGAISAAARSAWQAKVRRRRSRPLAAVLPAMAAMLAVAAGLAWWWGSRQEAPPSPPPIVARVEAAAGPVQRKPGEAIPLGETLRTGAGRVSLRLSGGAAVRVDTETLLRFASATVLELERGGVYVDTGTGSAVEVRTPVGTARDVGTQFSIRVVGSEMAVRVRDGAVLTEQRGRAWRTEPGQELVLRQDGTSEQRAVARHGAGWDWILAASPGFAIEGRSLGEFLDWVSRETGWRIVLDEGVPDSAAETVLHGGLGELRPDEAPFAVLPGAGLEGELEDGTLTVRLRSPR